MNQSRFVSVSSGRAQSVGSARHVRPHPEQHGAARRVAGARHGQAQLDARHLAGRLAADLAHRLDDVAEAVDVGLAEVAAAGVDRQPAVGPLEVAVGDEVVELLRLAEAHLGDGHQHRAGEVLVELGDVDVGGLHAGPLPQLSPDVAVVGGGEARLVERGDAVAMVEAVGGGHDRDTGALAKVARPLRRGDDDRRRAVVLRAAVVEVERLGDPA